MLQSGVASTVVRPGTSNVITSMRPVAVLQHVSIVYPHCDRDNVTTTACNCGGDTCINST